MGQELALSTCWNSHRHRDGEEMLVEIAELGFGRVELSHGVRMSLIPGVLDALEKGVVEVSSVHNFCPLPAAVQVASPNYYKPTSPYRSERVSWISQTIRTLQFCEVAKADRLVLHLGQVDFWFRDPWQKHQKYLAKWGENLTPEEIETSREGARRKLLERQEKILPRLRECLDAVKPAAERHGVIMAAENREDVKEVPVDASAPGIWTGFLAGYDVGYWHDTGHARLKEMDGMLQHETWLEGVKDRILGWHFHDVDGQRRDHQIPGSGAIDFEAIGKFVKPEHRLTLELHPGLEAEQVREGRAFLERALKI